MQSFTPGSALLGGLLIGLGAVVLMLLLGRIAGISGIVGGLLDPSGSIPTDGSHSLAESNHQIIGSVDRTITRLGFKRVIRSTSGRDFGWRLAFVIGLIAGPAAVALVEGNGPEIRFDAPLPLVLVTGALVGFGTRLGSGCTSGHGVCGLARLSARSLIATVVFFIVAAIVVFINRHVLGG